MIFAAAMQDKCDGVVFNQAIASMLQTNDQPAKVLGDHHVKACTDVNGFGLFGHLYELCQASSCSAILNLNAIPILPGVEDLALQNIKSSLYAQNRKAFETLKWQDSITSNTRFNLLFDPQTSGGLLAGIPAERYATLDDNFHQQFYTIGEIVGLDESLPQIQIVES